MSSEWKARLNRWFYSAGISAGIYRIAHAKKVIDIVWFGAILAFVWLPCTIAAYLNDSDWRAKKARRAVPSPLTDADQETK